MKRKIITTEDGSTTIHIVDWDEHYHSKHGAIQEAYHVFIYHGLSAIDKKQLSVMEMGFGTGLNAFITLLEADKRKLHINYTGIEAYPIRQDELEKLNYVSALKAEGKQHIFDKIHSCTWEEPCSITDYFSILKRQIDFNEVSTQKSYDLIYFDAFGARVQPELWTATIFEKMFNALRKNGVLVTYAAKGSVRRAMLAVGFKVERLPGPPGKREMLRATKA